MPRTLDTELEALLTAKGATELEKQMLLGFLIDQQASAIGRVNGLASAAADLNRQQAEVQAEVDRVTAMLDKFTNIIPDEPA